MFAHRRIELAPVIPPEPLRMPLDILLALAPRQTPGPLEAFNVLAVCTEVLGHFGWARATRVLNPKVWAPDWSPERFSGLVLEAGLDPALGSGIRVDSFIAPGTSPETAAPAPARYDIVHFVGEVFNEGSDQSPALVLGDGSDAPVVRPGALRDALVSAGARLLILQVGLTGHRAIRLAEFIAGGGGPAVLVVGGRHSERLREYLVQFYAGIVHNHPLPEIAAPQDSSPDAPDVTLVSSPEADTGLLFTQFLTTLRGELTTLAAEIESRATQLRTRSASQEMQLHRVQKTQIEGWISELEQQGSAAREDIDRLSALEGEIWSHESTGVIPLSEMAEHAESVQAARALYPVLEAEIEEAAARAPRVLNANFADPKTRDVIGADSALIAGRAYDFLVDIGPRWNTVPSIVSGNADFPEQALPPTDGGSVLTVLLVSSDFTPRTLTAEIWLPYPSGRSRPIIDGERSENAGPVALRLTAPKLPAGSDTGRAQARLGIYLGHNLLQSAVIAAGIARQAAELAEPSRIEVDYAMSGTFHDLEERYSTRDLHFPAEAETVHHPVALNFTLNNDGAANHRIIVNGDAELPAGWSAYDPAGAAETLKRLRRELLNCFLKRDKTGEPQPDLGLNQQNGKDFEQFRRDLFVLARLGEKLYSEVLIASWSEDSGLTSKAWERELRRRLDRSRVIQIARTGSAQYTYPWGLMYEYPLPGMARELRWCDVLRQWSDDGIRNGPPELRCPFADEEYHQENILCPYGFWGLKHIIEQPLSVFDRETGTPRDLSTQIPVDGDVRLAAGWTSDAALDAQWMNAHREQLLTLPGIRFADPQPNPARDLASIRAVLAAPSRDPGCRGAPDRPIGDPTHDQPEAERAPFIHRHGQPPRLDEGVGLRQQWRAWRDRRAGQHPTGDAGGGGRLTRPDPMTHVRTVASGTN